MQCASHILRHNLTRMLLVALRQRVWSGARAWRAGDTTQSINYLVPFNLPRTLENGLGSPIFITSDCGKPLDRRFFRSGTNLSRADRRKWPLLHNPGGSIPRAHRYRQSFNDFRRGCQRNRPQTWHSATHCLVQRQIRHSSAAP